MCTPALLGTLSTVATVVGTVGSAIQGIGAARAQKKQQQEVVAWQRQQKLNRDQEKVRQEELRQGAEAAQQGGLEQVSGESQTKRQEEEQARLESYLAGDTQPADSAAAPVSVADAQLSGQNLGDPTFTSNLAAKINEATGDARKRIKALAGVSSYGGSFGGLGTVNPLLQSRAGAEIDKFNEFRRGSLGALDVEKAVDPVQITYNPGPLGDIFSTALQVGSAGMGNAFGGKGGIFGSAGKVSQPAVVGGDPWAGLRNVGKFSGIF